MRPITPDLTAVHDGLGTRLSHSLSGPQAQACLTAIRVEIAHLEARLSRFRRQSDISRVNRAAGKDWTTVHPETFALLSAARGIFRTTGGRYDPTIGPLVQAWQTLRDAHQAPDAAKIRQTLSLVQGRDLSLDSENCRVRLERSGQSLDLGGIGKGFVGDRLTAQYARFGIRSAYANLGGNVITRGTRPDGAPWQIGIQHPRQPAAILGVVPIAGESVVTSGDYQRVFTGHGGQRYHHILDPRTGYPAKSGLVSVTIISRNALLADALATAVFIAGREKGLTLLAAHPQCEGILVSSTLQITLTRGLEGRFQPAPELETLCRINHQKRSITQ